MKLNWKMISLTMAASVMLAACGSDSDNLTTDKQTDSVKTVEQDQNQQSADKETASGSETAADPADGQLEDGERVTSDTQDFSIEVVPGYTLTGEEPGRDVLYADDDAESFMRIETRPYDEAGYDELVDNTKDLLAASTDGTVSDSTDTLALLSNGDIEQPEAFTSSSDEVITTGAVFKRGSLLVRVVVYDAPANEHTDLFLKMANTIENTN